MDAIWCVHEDSILAKYKRLQRNSARILSSSVSPHAFLASSSSRAAPTAGCGADMIGPRRYRTYQTTITHLQRRLPHSKPLTFGRYPVLQASSAITSYPLPRPVPDHIIRPSYVPGNFSSAPWGDHDVPPDPLESEGRIQIGGEEERAVKTVSRMAAEVLRNVGLLVKVCAKLYE